MKLPLLLVFLWTLTTFSLQTDSPGQCVCEFRNSEQMFPHDKLRTAENEASDCNSRVSPWKTTELQGLMLGLDRRLVQLQEDVSVLEKEDDGDLYGVLSLNVIHNEMTEIRLLLDKLNTTTEEQHKQTAATTHRMEQVRAEMEQLETFDTQQVVKRQEANQRLRRDLDKCRNGLHAGPPPTEPPNGSCPYGEFLNISEPRVYTAGEYPGSYKYGAWGRDPKPEPGKESWHWLVLMTSSNRYSNYVRQYHSLSSLIVGQSVPGNVLISSSNPTTNTIQGPNVVLYGGSLYYNCYNQHAVCRFNLTSKTVTNVDLPQGTRYNSKGTSATWMSATRTPTWTWPQTSRASGWSTPPPRTLVIWFVKVEEGEPPKLNQTWHTSVFKQGVTNTFMACGVLYATRYVSKTRGDLLLV
uniref:Olfactomedin-like domain-containing protein n=1 Tax=Amphiprion percula TaxID=161767 RepID=A0A3P8SQ96_AMPPE